MSFQKEKDKKKKQISVSFLLEGSVSRIISTSTIKYTTFLLLLRFLPILPLVFLLALVAEPEETETKYKCQNCQYHNSNPFFR